MSELISLMLPPFVACLILTGIHTYLGLHVVSRGVIFVDLALAQIAALGTTYAFLLGFDPLSQPAYYYSLVFTFIGAAVFSLSRLKDHSVPQEAIIGIVFAVSSSFAVLIADRAPQGAEHVEAMLTGSILWVSWEVIWKTFLIYSAIALFHFLFRHRFLLISMNPQEAVRQGLAVRWWDFLFYVSFGFVITSSVAIAGILLVFSFLIIPSVIGMLYSSRIGPRLLIGWASGTLVSLLGLYFSYRFDLPSGPSVVCTFGVVLTLAALIRYVLHAEEKGMALARVGGGLLLVGALFFVSTRFQPAAPVLELEEQTVVGNLQEIVQNLNRGAALAPERLQYLTEHLPLTLQLVRDGAVQLEQEALQTLAAGGDARLIPLVRQALQKAADPWLRFYCVQALLQLGDKTALHELIRLLEPEVPPFLRARVLEVLTPITGQDFGYDPTAPAEANESALNRLEVWWHQNAERIQWDPASRSFQLQGH